MKTRKRILAAVLTAIMMISMLPANTFATETVGNVEAESAVEAVSMSSEEHEVETTVEDVSEEKTDESSEVVQADETADPAAVEEVETVSEEETEAAGDAEAVTETAEAASEPVTLTASTKEYTVKVTYDPATAEIPADAEVSVEEILEKDKVYDTYVEQAADAIESDVDSLSYVKLLDISIVNADKTPVEPSSPVDVQICLKDVDEVQDNTQVVHFGKESTDVIEPDVKGNEVSFETDGFSIYAVIGTGDYARLTVNFYGAKNAATGEYDLIDTMYVKRGDQSSADRIKQIVYDPGAGTIPSGYGFYGWSIGEEDYSIAVDGSTEGSSIDDVRTYIQGYSIPEGDTGVLNIYAMMATHYTVKYIDLDGLSLGTDTALVKTAGEEVSYTVNMNYSHDSEHDFDGWFVHEGLSNITDPSDATGETLFPNDTVIKITGNVEFSVSAPEGHWLIFDENGKHATYNAPRFVRGGNDTTDEGMLEMIRTGYEFDGWWTGAPTVEGGDPTGQRFEFGHQLASTTTVYAKWTPASEAKYTVIIWKEGITQGSYDFFDTLTFTGTVGTSASDAVTTAGSGKTLHALINGGNYEAEDYRGFSYKSHTQNVTINPEGDAVVNVYYDRNTYTLRFVYGWFPFYGDIYQEITARYGTYIGDRFPLDISAFDGPISSWIDQNFGKWAPPSDSPNFDNNLVYIDIMPDEDSRFTLAAPTGSRKTMNYYVEVLPGQTGTTTFNGKSFVLLNTVHGRYNYFTESEDYLDLVGYDKYGTDPAFVNGRITDSNTLNCYYTRQLKTINYMNGAYYDGNNNRMEVGTGQLGAAEGIPYNSDISSYNKGKDNYFVPAQEEGFVFEGWYVDETCTVPYTFDRMPSGGISVYAKWRQIEYRVFLRPNADHDTTLNWGSDAQKMNFRVAYGDKVSLPEGIRTGYKFYGWHTDSALTTPVYATSYVMNETTVWDTYDKTLPENMTDPNDKWGTYGNSNADVDRWWMTKRLELFAKWGRTTVGADGIGIIYVSGEDGTVPPTDTMLYQDNTNAVAGASPKANPGKVFEKWIVQKWDGSKFVDTGVEVLPGKKFSVYIEDAKIVEDETGDIVPISAVDANKHYTYTIQVRAEYSDAEEVVPTHITWYKNDGSGESYREDTEIKINEAVSVYGLGDEGIPTRNGYKFLGWAKDIERENIADPPNTSTETTTADFLEYRAGSDGSKGKFYQPNTETEITQVAADEVTPYEALYAIWEREKFYIYHSATGETEEVDMPEEGGVDLTAKVTSGYLYGGYFTYKEDGDHKDAFVDKGIGTGMEPTAGETYYLKEVSPDYLKPNIYLIYSTIHNGLIQDLYGFVNIDDLADYKDFGLMIGGTKKSVLETAVTDYISVTRGGDEIDKLTQDSLFGTEGVFGYANLKEYVDFGVTVQITGYYVTKDKIRVTGYKDRMIKFDADDRTYDAPVFTGWNSGGNTKCGLKSVTPTLEPAAGLTSAGMLAARRTLTLAAPADQIEYTITKVYDTGSEEQQIVQEGNHIGEITYTERNGYLFAGWYKDQAFTEPADFSDVQSNMTGYARFVSSSDISMTVTRKSQKSGTITFNTVVKVNDKYGLGKVNVNLDGADAVLSVGSVKKSGSGKNVRYTTQYQGTVPVKGLSVVDSFTGTVSWTTPDGTVVTGRTWTCTYVLGLVTVR